MLHIMVCAIQMQQESSQHYDTHYQGAEKEFIIHMYKTNLQSDYDSVDSHNRLLLQL